MRILIVEDDLVIAMGLVDAVVDCGGEVIGPLQTVGEALAVLENTPVSAAILDACLLDRDITPVALLLASDHLPMVIYSGTGVPADLARQRPDIAFVPKPTPPAEVIRVLCGEVEKKRPKTAGGGATQVEKIPMPRLT